MKPKKAKTKTLFTPTEVGTLIERLESNFKLFGEKLDSLEAKVDGIGVNQARTLERITAIELRLTSIEKRLTSVEKEIVGIKRELKEIKVKLDRKVELAQFKILESRVTTLEKKVEILLTR